VQAGHLPAQLQERAERAQGLDYTTVVARISDIAQRARQTALEAADAGDRAGVLKAGDSELRALAVLTANGESSETEMQLRAAFRDVSAAAFRIARRDPNAAETIAAELDAMHRPSIAEEIRDQAPSSEIERG
jgi:alkylhydroperoxidase/carboxymuconolactone decarboxylase family protein YurZ